MEVKSLRQKYLLSKITDLAEVMCGHRDFDIVGIRPGEKLHEVLCPKDLSSRIVEFKDFFIIKPVFNLSEDIHYDETANNEVGKLVAGEFEYTSENNPHFLSVAEIKKLIS
jgi:UDP-N-acetylglucosamine 4,6-dehydratase